MASFTIEALPAEAFEALLIVATWLGEVLVDDPPYQLDVELGEPFDCWCRLDLVPDAGASTVAVTLVAPTAAPCPTSTPSATPGSPTLNHLGRPDPSECLRRPSAGRGRLRTLGRSKHSGWAGAPW